MDELESKKRTSIFYSQSNIQPLQQSYLPGNQLNIYIQPQANVCMDLGKQILIFRPVYQTAALPGTNQLDLAGLARAQFIQPVSIDEQSHFTVQSISIASSQVLSQTQVSLNGRTRSIFQAYYNSLTRMKKKKHLGDSQTITGQRFSSTNGSTLIGGASNLSPTHPLCLSGISQSDYATNTNMGATSSSQIEGPELQVLSNAANQGSLFGGSATVAVYLPRALVDHSKKYYDDFSHCVQANQAGNPVTYQSQQSNIYYTSQMTANSDGKAPIIFPTSSANMAMKGKQLTPSISTYLKQQANFENYRRRFLTQCTSYIPIPFLNQTPTNTQYSGINQTAAVNPLVSNGGANGVAQTSVLEQGQTWSSSVQNGFFLPGQSSQTSIGQVTFNQGMQSQPTAANSIYTSETFTFSQVLLRTLSIELDQIGPIALHDKPIQIILQCNAPQNVLSCFAQPTLIAAQTDLGSQIALNTGPSAAQIKGFLDGLTLQNATYSIQDVCMRLEYDTYQPEAYQIISEKMDTMPRQYMSLRQQIDVIQGGQGSFQMSQRVAINNPYLLGSISFCVKSQNNTSPAYISTAQGTINPHVQDACLNYGSNGVCDLRATYVDSYNLACSSFYIDPQSSSIRAEANDPPIPNPQYTTWLRSQDAISQIFPGFSMEAIDYQQYLQNRFFLAIAYNTQGCDELMLTSSQIMLQLNIDYTPKQQSAWINGEQITTFNNNFSLLTFLITGNTLLGTQVKVGA